MLLLGEASAPAYRQLHGLCSGSRRSAKVCRLAGGFIRDCSLAGLLLFGLLPTKSFKLHHAGALSIRYFELIGRTLRVYVIGYCHSAQQIALQGCSASRAPQCNRYCLHLSLSFSARNSEQIQMKSCSYLPPSSFSELLLCLCLAHSGPSRYIAILALFRHALWITVPEAYGILICMSYHSSAPGLGTLHIHCTWLS